MSPYAKSIAENWPQHAAHADAIEERIRETHRILNGMTRADFLNAATRAIREMRLA